MSNKNSTMEIKAEQDSMQTLSRNLDDLAKQLDQMPAKIKPLTGELQILAQVSKTVEAIRLSQYLTGIANNAITAAKEINHLSKSQNGLTRIGTSLLGVLGGPLGLAITLGTLATSFLTTAIASDRAREKFLNLDDKLENILKKYKDLNALDKITFKYELQDEKKDFNNNLDNLIESSRKLFVNGGTHVPDFTSETDGVGGALANAYLFTNAKEKGGDEAFQKLKNVIDSNTSESEKAEQIKLLFHEFVEKGAITIENAKELQKSLLVDLSSALKQQEKITAIDKVLNNESSESSKNNPPETLEEITRKLQEQYQIQLDKNKAEQENNLLLEKRETLLAQIAENKSERLSKLNKTETSDKLNKLDNEYESSRDILRGGYDEATNLSLDPSLSEEAREEQLQRQLEFQMALTDIDDEYSDKRKKIIDEEQEKRVQNQMELLDSASQLFGSMGDLIGAFGGESSGAYKAMFAISKGFSIASATLSMFTNIGKATEMGFPANLPLIAKATAQGVQLISSIKGTNISGQAHAGIDYIPREGTWLLDEGERVLSPRQNADLTSFLQNGTEKDLKIVINNNVGANVSAEYDEKEEIVRIAVNRAVKEVSNQLSSGTGITSRALRERWNTNTKVN